MYWSGYLLSGQIQRSSFSTNMTSRINYPPQDQSTGLKQQHTVQRRVEGDEDYDYLSDQHNLIIGSIVLLLTLAGLVIAYLTLRQGRHHRPVHSTSTYTNGSSDVELGSLGQLCSSVTIHKHLFMSLAGRIDADATLPVTQPSNSPQLNNTAAYSTAIPCFWTIALIKCS